MCLFEIFDEVRARYEFQNFVPQWFVNGPYFEVAVMNDSF